MNDLQKRHLYSLDQVGLCLMSFCKSGQLCLMQDDLKAEKFLLLHMVSVLCAVYLRHLDSLMRQQRSYL